MELFIVLSNLNQAFGKQEPYMYSLVIETIENLWIKWGNLKNVQSQTHYSGVSTIVVFQ